MVQSMQVCHEEKIQRCIHQALINTGRTRTARRLDGDHVLHNWSDEDCVKILTQCRQAISHGAKAGKVIIIDTVVGSPSHQMLEAQVTMDLAMMMLFNGKAREEHNWHKMFMEAGFSHYKIHNVLGMRSLIDVHP
ncbi:flavonoid O-methyltransferase-like protein Os11g0303600 [Triticum aestivum]|uniref:flavonoid O-methyltransferase-like protein Os11g0303600 n=1 Tax=Triticum aestivum TaxID=4565 RepID=UPI001D00D560|nr:flavonoid O-methyltransferase-like protein Os11g0303600 [Triticum aestivum]